MKKTFIVLLFSSFLISAFAHEYVLIAYKYVIAKGDKLELHLFVADGFNVQQERSYQKSITKKFNLQTADHNIDLTATNNGEIPVLNYDVDFEGLALVSMERDYASNTMPTNKFLEYLKEDHMEDIIPKVNLSKVNQKETYTRYLKALVLSGKAKNDNLYQAIVGQNFEIVLLKNPYNLHAGDMIKAQVLFMGKPLVSKIITARNRKGSEPSIFLNSKTDQNGICSFKLKRNGDWFIHATHMIACNNKPDTDWESFWTSYSFGIQ